MSPDQNLFMMLFWLSSWICGIAEMEMRMNLTFTIKLGENAKEKQCITEIKDEQMSVYQDNKE